jgi:glutamate-1-semialdehyde 2,1-aminomutase
MSAERSPGPGVLGSEEIYAKAVTCLPGGSTRSTLSVWPHPPYASRGQGYRVVDADGHEVIDLQANMSALVHGHAHPAIVDTIKSAVEDGVSFGLPTATEVELARHLVDRIQALELVRFANSGTEAVMTVLRLARAHTGRDAILRFAGCYHGTYDAVLADGSVGVPAAMRDTVITVPFGDIVGFEQAIRKHASRLAAVIIDLMPNRLGLVPVSMEFARAVRALTRELDVLLIVDEVITFRLEYGGLHATYDLDPDLITLGKVIGGGLPIGAFGGRRALMEMFDPRVAHPLEQGGTFTANPLVMRAGLTALELLTRSEIERINRLGDVLRMRLTELGYQVNGRGSLSCVISDDPTGLWWKLYRAGVLIGRSGLMCIATVMTEATVDEIARRLESVAGQG